MLLDNRFATLPHVVAEGRRVIGNIERVATLFLTKTVYSVLLAIVIGILGLIGRGVLAYPFLPRHITLVGWFTIGLPAFVLSLAPNNERARGGFVGRVLRLALPAGIVIAMASFTAYVLVYNRQIAGEVARIQASTTALLTLIAIALWVLARVARPFVWWKIVLVAVMGTVSALMFVLPLSRRLFQLDPSNLGYTAVAALCAATGTVLIELAWWATARLSRSEQPPQPGDEPLADGEAPGG